MQISAVWFFFTIAVIICILMAHRFLTVSRRNEYKKAFLFKGCAGLCFIAAGGLTASLCPDRRFALFVTAGLILGLAGDQFLALRFVYSRKSNAFFTAGGGAFAAGHVLYILALLQSHTPLLKAAVPVGLAGFAASVIYARIREVNAGPMQIPLMIYRILLSTMLAAAWGTVFRHLSPGQLLFAAGSLLFLISDNILFAFYFGKRQTSGMNRAIHGTYYAAQLSIALSMGLL